MAWSYETQLLGIFAAGFCQGVCAFPGHAVDLEGAECLLQKGTKKNNQRDAIAKTSTHARTVGQVYAMTETKHLPPSESRDTLQGVFMSITGWHVSPFLAPQDHSLQPQHSL